MKRDWNSHVALRLLARAQTYGRACVSSLSCSGGLVVAGDFLGSATVLQLLATRRGVVLAPTSVDRRPVFAQVGVNASTLSIAATASSGALTRCDLTMLAQLCHGAFERQPYDRQPYGSLGYRFNHVLLLRLCPWTVPPAGLPGR